MDSDSSGDALEHFTALTTLLVELGGPTHLLFDKSAVLGKCEIDKSAADVTAEDVLAFEPADGDRDAMAVLRALARELHQEKIEGTGDFGHGSSFRLLRR
jgi:hypothetical protein